MGDDEAPPARFGTVRKGLDPEEVDAFIAAVEASISTRQDELRDLLAGRPEDAAPEEGPDDHLARFLGLAESQAATMIGEAKDEAKRLVAESEREADRIVTEAQTEADGSLAEAEAALGQAREQTDRMAAELAERRRTTLEGLESMRARLLSLLPDIERALDRSVSEDGSKLEP